MQSLFICTVPFGLFSFRFLPGITSSYNQHLLDISPLPQLKPNILFLLEGCSSYKLQEGNFSKFDFVIRCATINKDVFNDYYHAFLVPDEGYSNIVKIHDKLYSDKLKKELRLDIDLFHTLESETPLILSFANKWSTGGMLRIFSIKGTVTHLTIVRYDNNVVTTVEENELK